MPIRVLGFLKSSSVNYSDDGGRRKWRKINKALNYKPPLSVMWGQNTLIFSWTGKRLKGGWGLEMAHVSANGNNCPKTRRRPSVTP